MSTEWSRPSDTPSTEVSSGPASTETQTPAPSDTPGSTATVTTDAPTSSSSNPADQSTSETAPASLTTDSHPSSIAGTTSSVSSTASLPTSTPVAPQVDPQVYLDAHNDVRRRARVSDLEWSNDLQGKAQAYANQCQLKHSDGSIGPFGENLAAATGTFGARRAVALFVKDKGETDHSALYYTSHMRVDLAKLSLRDFAFTHYTQVIWKSTTQLGCGVALCDNMFSGRAATYHVCLYDPVGNIVGEEEFVSLALHSFSVTDTPHTCLQTESQLRLMWLFHD